VPRRPPLHDNLTVRQNLRFLVDAEERAGAGRAERTVQVIAACGLAPYLDKPAGSLDDPRKRQLALAIALLAQPTLLLLDGPASGTDLLSRRDLWRVIDVLAVGGVAVVIASDLVEDAERCDRVALLDRGRARIGTPAALNTFAAAAGGATAQEEGSPATTGDEQVL
jgi:ABC-2 type transport system ATP-binding protein